MITPKNITTATKKGKNDVDKSVDKGEIVLGS
jgi:hypothetical protein